MKVAEFKDKIVAALTEKTTPDGWRITHSYELNLHEIHIRTPNHRAWVYEAKEQPNLPEYKHSGWCIETY